MCFTDNSVFDMDGSIGTTGTKKIRLFFGIIQYLKTF